MISIGHATVDLTTVATVIGAAILLLLVLVLLLRRPRTGKTPDAVESEGVADSAAAAVEDMIGELIGVDAHPALPIATGDPDPLTQLKGLGPKAAAQLNALGITRFDQLAALDAAQLAAVDGQMGNFKGRIYRDRWADQARLMAAGDRAAFEAEFGKLG